MLKPLIPCLSTVLMAGSLSVAVGSLFPLPTLASNFSRLYVFSDSLSDTGNTLTVTTQLNAIDADIPILPPPSLGYYQGRFSNNQIWLDFLAKGLYLPLPPSSVVVGGANPQGVNFAVNSATTGNQSTFPVPFPAFVGLEQQIDQFQQSNPIADPKALYILWAGANDYLGAQITDPTVPVGNLTTAVQDLYQVGARRFLVGNLPLLGQTPIVLSRGTTVAESLNQLTIAHNGLLSQSINTLNELPDIDVRLLDVDSLFAEAITQPENFGFTVVDAPCLVNSPLFPPVTGIPSQCSNPDEYLFWDALHPSSATHQAVARLALRTLAVPESSPVVGILTIGLLLMGGKLIQKK